MKLITKYNDFLNEANRSSTPIELTELVKIPTKKAEKLVRDNYHDNITYRGEEFYDKIYMNIIIPFAEEELEVGKRVEHEFYDEEEDDFYTEMGELDGQEVYLGYLPDEDIFISGWDMDYDYTNVAYIKLNDKLKPFIQKPKKVPQLTGGYIYSHGKLSEYNKLHKAFKNLIDIRLD